MTENIANQIATLINSRNELAVQYTAQKVLNQADDHLWVLQTDSVIGVVRVQRVRWYQAEISHLSVHADCGRSGIGTTLLNRALERAAALGARIAQCTIRDTNTPSIGFFTKHGFASTTEFFYPPTGNTVRVFQRPLTTA